MRKVEEILKDLPENIRGPIFEAFIAFRDDVILKEISEVKQEISRVWKAIEELALAQKRTEQIIQRFAEEHEKLKEEVRKLAEAQARTEQQIQRLAEEQERLRDEVRKLAEAQMRTEQQVQKLAEAQARTEQQVQKLMEAQARTEQQVQKLTEAQARTEQQIQRLAEEQERLRDEVRKLAEAQMRTEQQVQKLAEEHEKLREEVKKLVEAQSETERRLQMLIKEHEKTRENLAGLSHTVGHLLEDRAIKSLHKILKKYGIEVVGELSRDYIEVGGEYIEVNIYGKAIKDGKEYILLGEAKTRVSIKAIDEFIEKCDLISKEAIKVFISYIFPPHIKEYAKEKRIILIPSYQLEL
jgi:chromosome segregation ATPase